VLSAATAHHLLINGTLERSGRRRLEREGDVMWRETGLGVARGVLAIIFG